MSEHHCYACSFRWDNPHIGGWRLLNRAVMYEEVVETIEAWSGPFSTMQVWRKIAGGPPYLSVVKNVIADLRVHRLIVCIRMDRPQRCCLRWMKAEDCR